jgi:hypothetical protein
VSYTPAFVLREGDDGIDGGGLNVLCNLVCLDREDLLLGQNISLLIGKEIY